MCENEGFAFFGISYLAQLGELYYGFKKMSLSTCYALQIHVRCPKRRVLTIAIQVDSEENPWSGSVNRIHFKMSFESCFVRIYGFIKDCRRSYHFWHLGPSTPDSRRLDWSRYCNHPIAFTWKMLGLHVALCHSAAYVNKYYSIICRKTWRKLSISEFETAS